MHNACLVQLHLLASCCSRPGAPGSSPAQLKASFLRQPGWDPWLVSLQLNRVAC